MILCYLASKNILDSLHKKRGSVAFHLEEIEITSFTTQSFDEKGIGEIRAKCKLTNKVKVPVNGDKAKKFFLSKAKAWNLKIIKSAFLTVECETKSPIPARITVLFTKEELDKINP